MLLSQGRPLFQCHACRRQTSLTAGTLFGSTMLPLSTWFLAIYFIGQAKTGMSALELERHIGVSYPTAWLLHHKIMTAMLAQERQHRLDGVVQVDDAYLGAFAYRVNRRFDLADLVCRLVVDVSRRRASPERAIRQA